jgi:site-specific recombinase XerD
MKPIPFSLQKQFESYLNNNVIPGRSQGTYKKWLQYYLDFCHKYDFSPDHQESLPQFIQKLQEKRQTKAQQELASKAITLYYQFVKSRTLPDEAKAIQPQSPKGYMSLEVDKPFTNSITVSEPVHNKSGEYHIKKRASWIKEYSMLEDEIRVRHYSSSTLRTYKGWVRKFQAFTSSNPPELLSSNDVKEYLTFLAVKRKVSSTTQNQAFNALLFFYRNSLKKEFGKIDGVVRAKRKPYIPVVLSREEIDTVL